MAGFGLTALTNVGYFLHNIRYMQRWIFASYVWLWVFAGLGFALFAAWIVRRTGRSVGPAFVVAALAIMVAQPAITAVGRSQALAAPDTRVRAREWIECNIPSGSTLVLDGPRYLVPQVQECPSSVRSRLAALPDVLKPPFTHLDRYYRFQLLAAQKRSGPQYTVIRVKHRGDLAEGVDPQDLGNPVAPEYVLDRSFAGFAEEDVEYVVVTETAVRNRFAVASMNARQFYSEMMECCEVVKRIAPASGETGPVLLVLKRAASAGPERETGPHMVETS